MPEHDPLTRPSDTAQDQDVAVAFEAFYRQMVTPLVGFLMMQQASLADAAEIAQDTLSSAYQRWRTLQNPRAWAYRVASRALVRRLASSREDPAADPPEPSPLLRATPAEAWHTRQELTTALDTLPPRQRQVMAWTLSGYTPAEIAVELHLTSDQVRASLRLARRALAARLHDGEGTA